MPHSGALHAAQLASALAWVVLEGQEGGMGLVESVVVGRGAVVEEGVGWAALDRGVEERGAAVRGRGRGWRGWRR